MVGGSRYNFADAHTKAAATKGRPGDVFHVLGGCHAIQSLFFEKQYRTLAVTILTLLALIFSAVRVTPVYAAGILYVRPDGSGDCSSWANACTLQAALSSGDETASNMLAYDTDWDDPASLETLCRTGGGQTYLYTGGTTFSFPSEELARQTWLQPVFRAQQVQLYQVTGCNQP